MSEKFKNTIQDEDNENYYSSNDDEGTLFLTPRQSCERINNEHDDKASRQRTDMTGYVSVEDVESNEEAGADVIKKVTAGGEGLAQDFDRF